MTGSHDTGDIPADTLARLTGAREGVLEDIAVLQSSITAKRESLTRINSAIRALTGTVALPSPPGTGEIIRRYVDSLPPGGLLNVDNLLAFAEQHQWLTNSLNRRGAVLSRLAKLATAGLLVKGNSPGEYHRPGSLTYTADGLPAGLSIDPATGIISGVPTATGPGNAIVTMHAVQPIDGYHDRWQCSCGATFASGGQPAVCPHAPIS